LWNLLRRREGLYLQQLRRRHLWAQELRELPEIPCWFPALVALSNRPQP
jgi:hypothetical protein